MVSAVRESGNTKWIRLEAAVTGGTFDFEVPAERHWQQQTPCSLPSTVAVAASPWRRGAWRIALAGKGGDTSSNGDAGGPSAVVLYLATTVSWRGGESALYRTRTMRATRASRNAII